MNTIRFLFIISLFMSPFSSHATIEISEIMYDHEGTDTGNEWIEIHNIGNSSIDMQQWSFRENEVNHGLQFEGATVIAPDARMVIVQNVNQFSSLYDNTISLIKSSFSLNNTGEVLEMINENDEVVDSYNYTSETGAQGDGNSLQKIADTWTVGKPTPGSVNQNTAQTNADDTANTDEEKTQNNSSNKSDRIVVRDVRKKEKFQIYYEPYITFPEVIVTHSPQRFQVGVFRIEEYSRIHKKGGIYYLNFGDGTVIESNERIDEFHRYPAAGSYLVTLEYYSSTLQYEHGEPELVYQKNIEVVDMTVNIKGVSGYGGVTLENTGSQNIDMSNWTLQGSGLSYTFPRHSIIRPSSTISVSHNQLGFWANEDVIQHLSLFNDILIPVDTYQSPKQQGKERQQVMPTEASITDIELGEDVLYLDDYAGTEPADTDLKDEPTTTSVYEFSQEEEVLEESSYQYLAFGIGSIVILTGVTRYFYTRRKQYTHELHTISDSK